jgi:hypothetical protein
MPVRAGTSQKVIGANIRELMKGKQYEETKRTHGAGTARRQAIAVALDKARESGAKIPKK